MFAQDARDTTGGTTPLGSLSVQLEWLGHRVAAHPHRPAYTALLQPIATSRTPASTSRRIDVTVAPRCMSDHVPHIQKATSEILAKNRPDCAALHS